MTLWAGCATSDRSGSKLRTRRFDPEQSLRVAIVFVGMQQRGDGRGTAMRLKSASAIRDEASTYLSLVKILLWSQSQPQLDVVRLRAHHSARKLEASWTLRSMPTPPSKAVIFISYAPADEPEKPADGEVKWLSFVTGHLRAAEEVGALEIWTEPLAPGADLDPEGQRKLRACDVFIPLVSNSVARFRDDRWWADRHYPRAPDQGRGRLSLSAPVDAGARDDARHRESAATRRQALFELRRRRAGSANARRGGRDRGNRHGRSGAEDKASDETAAVATCAHLAGCAAAAH